MLPDMKEEEQDCLLLCQDGFISLNRLLVGLLFPELASSQVTLR
jgi:hypothetical protein